MTHQLRRLRSTKSRGFVNSIFPRAGKLKSIFASLFNERLFATSELFHHWPPLFVLLLRWMRSSWWRWCHDRSPYTLAFVVHPGETGTPGSQALNRLSPLFLSIRASASWVDPDWGSEAVHLRAVREHYFDVHPRERGSLGIFGVIQTAFSHWYLWEGFRGTRVNLLFGVLQANIIPGRTGTPPNSHPRKAHIQQLSAFRSDRNTQYRELATTIHFSLESFVLTLRGVASLNGQEPWTSSRQSQTLGREDDPRLGRLKNDLRELSGSWCDRSRSIGVQPVSWWSRNFLSGTGQSTSQEQAQVPRGLSRRILRTGTWVSLVLLDQDWNS